MTSGSLPFYIQDCNQEVQHVVFPSDVTFSHASHLYLTPRPLSLANLQFAHQVSQIEKVYIGLY